MAVPEHDLTAFENLDRVDRERWSIACAATFKAYPAELTHAIAAGGFRKFLAIARPIWRVHGFQYEDYRRAYEWIVARSKRLMDRGILRGGGEQIRID